MKTQMIQKRRIVEQAFISYCTANWFSQIRMNRDVATTVTARNRLLNFLIQ